MGIDLEEEQERRKFECKIFFKFHRFIQFSFIEIYEEFIGLPGGKY
jgi:hypothetical protein